MIIVGRKTVPSLAQVSPKPFKETCRLLSCYLQSVNDTFDTSSDSLLCTLQL